jgi:Ser/Thr protein kinase RdoA (MazF antagonist)
MSIDSDILAAWGWRDAIAQPLAGGLINTTFAVIRGQTPIAVLQRLHPVFGSDVNYDIEAVTEQLAAQGLITPRLLRTVLGAAWVEHDDRIWRALTWVDGRAVDRLPDASWAEAGGNLVARYHRALENFDYNYRFVRAGVHDTDAHLARLRDRLAQHSLSTPHESWQRDAVDLGHRIVAMATWSFDLAAMPLRHIHGDLKISNLLFSHQSAVDAVCLVDLDTVGRGTLAFELGDAMRSWCNQHGEDSGLAISFDLNIFAAAMRGYFASLPSTMHARVERESIVHGLLRVCVELAARFCVDVFDDHYFGWDAKRFASRRAHNLVRAHGQFDLALSVAAQFDSAIDIVMM